MRFGTARGVLLCLLFHFNGLGGAPGGVDFFLALGAVGTHTHIVGGLGPVGGEGLGGGAILYRKVQKILLKVLGGGVLHLVAAARDFAPLNRDLLRLRRGGGADLWGGGQCFGADLAAFGAGLGAAVCGVRCHLEGVGGVGFQLADGAGGFVTFDRSYLGCFFGFGVVAIDIIAVGTGLFAPLESHRGRRTAFYLSTADFTG